MITIKLLDNRELISDNNYEAVISKLNRSSKFGQKDTIEEYMSDCASRVRIQTGAELRLDSYETFIQDLAKAGLIEIIEG